MVIKCRGVCKKRKVPAVLKKICVALLVSTGAVFGMQQGLVESSESSKVDQTKITRDQNFLLDKFWNGAYEKWRSGKLTQISPTRSDSDDARVTKIFCFLGLATSIQEGLFLGAPVYNLTEKREFPIDFEEQLKRLTDEAKAGTLLEKLDQDKLFRIWVWDNFE